MSDRDAFRVSRVSFARADEGAEEIRPATAPGALRAKVLGALDARPRGFGETLVFPGHDDGYLKLKTFCLPHWKPALAAAGVEHRGVYACRHTFAAWSIAAGVQLFYLSRIRGTSVTQIDATYRHLVPDSEEYLRGLLDAYDVRDDESAKDAQRR